MKKKIFMALAALSLATYGVSGDTNHLAEYRSKPGASENLPVGIVKEGFSKEFTDEALAAFNTFHYQMGGDHTLFYLTNTSMLGPTEEANPNVNYRPLVRNINEDIGKVKFRTNAREMTLDEYVVDPLHRLQGLMILHKGEVVYEAYPGINPTEKHIWHSMAKSSMGLIVAMLEEEGKIDLDMPIETYVPELIGTNWEGISVLNIVNMSAGLDVEESFENITNPDSVIVRAFASFFGVPNMKGELERPIDILKAAERLDEEAGEMTRYSSLTSMPLIMMAENVENKTWTKIFEEKIWGKIGARGSAVFGLTPDGQPMGYGGISTTLEDLARYALIYTPSWYKVADEKVVSDEVLTRMQQGGNTDAFKYSSTMQYTSDYFGEEPIYNTFHWDAAFADGAMYKNGNMGQGIYVDPARDVVAVTFATKLGEVKTPGFMRRVAKEIAGE